MNSPRGTLNHVGLPTLFAAGVICLTVLALQPASAVTIQWSAVGNPGNAADPTVMTTDGTSGYGAVAYNYNIDKYDVTNSQYVEFLNAKDPNGTSPLQLYNSHMSDPTGGIAYNSARPAAASTA